MNNYIAPSVVEHLSEIAKHFDKGKKISVFSLYYRKLLAHRLNKLIPHGSSVLEIGCGQGDLLQMINGSNKTGVDISKYQVQAGRKKFSDITFVESAGEFVSLKTTTFDYIILSDVLNDAADVETLLKNLKQYCHKNTRILINIYNTIWSPALRIAKRIGFASGMEAVSWLSKNDIINLIRLSGYDPFKDFSAILLPIYIPFISSFINRWIAPLFSMLCLSIFVIARIPKRRKANIVSVIVPARNEAGSILDVLERVPPLGDKTELIFVEGHSNDNTWDVIKNLPSTWKNGTIIKMQQTGKGKGNAVIEGFNKATGDILLILDSDLTMPPEDLPKFVEVLTSGIGDFANGVRLVYPMDEKAMKFANLIANKGFSLIFSWMLGQNVKDTLCGTKVMWREDYIRLHQNRSYFGDFDPFGDFDLLFGADKLNLKIVDVPIRYKERIYGDTNISRWRDGFILLKMVLFAARKIKFV